MKRTPSILTWHNDLPPVTSAASILADVHGRLSTLYLKDFSVMIATTSVYAKNSPTLRRYAERVRVISNGVDTVRFSPGLYGGGVREKHGLQGCRVVLFVGALTRWHSYKGLDVLIEAFAGASRDDPLMRLLVVGAGELLPKYQSLALHYNVAEKVHFAGSVDGSLLPEYYAASDTTVLPSRDSSEGFGLVLLEAMACGKAVIGSNVGGIPEIVRNGENGLLVQPGDPSALAAALRELLADDDGRMAMGRSGREFAELHDWNRVAVEVESIYRSSRESGQS